VSPGPGQLVPAGRNKASGKLQPEVRYGRYVTGKPTLAVMTTVANDVTWPTAAAAAVEDIDPNTRLAARSQCSAQRTTVYECKQRHTQQPPRSTEPQQRTLTAARS